MSLETALDEERREVMNILEGRTSQSRGVAPTPYSPFAQNVRVRSPPRPIRSMLDIDVPASPKQGEKVRSMLDAGSSRKTRHVSSTTPSSGTSQPSGSAHPKARSDITDFRPRPYVNDRETVDPNTDYQFNMLPSIPNQALPKRVTQGGKKQQSIGTMASIMQGQELGHLPRGRDTGRHNSTAGIGGSSKSQSSRLLSRSASPGTGMLMQTPGMQVPGKFMTDSGKIIDMNSAYRRLSDAALLKSGGKLSTLPTNTGTDRPGVGTGETLSATGEVRLQKDYYPDEEERDDINETSDEDLQTGSSADEALPHGIRRGRKRGRRRDGIDDVDSNADESEIDERNLKEGSVGLGKAPGPRKVKSLLAAAEEERKLCFLFSISQRVFFNWYEFSGVSISTRQKVRSLLEPTVTITGPGGERISNRKSGVHPNTNYDRSVSRSQSPGNSDSEELDDIRRAQSLSIRPSSIDSSVPHRVIRTILRGDFARMQREAGEGIRRLRTYLVATDLSGEAAYALEWTIGTVLRDGDTLLAIYAVDEEVGTGKGGDADSTQSLPIGEGAKSIQDTTAMIERMTLLSQHSPSISASPSPMIGSSLKTGSRNDSSAGSADSRYLSKAEQERLHAIEGISQTCIKFLRKTKLQVRIAIEVIHCKSPKYMITEAVRTFHQSFGI